MTWNKNNPRFRRSSILGSRSKKNSLFSRINNRFNKLFNANKGKAPRSHLVPPPEPGDELKLALPKSKKHKVSPPPPAKAASPAIFTADNNSRSPVGGAPVQNGFFRSSKNRPGENSKTEAEAKAKISAVKKKIQNLLASPRPTFSQDTNGLDKRPAQDEKMPLTFSLNNAPGNLGESSVSGDGFKINHRGHIRRRSIRPPLNEKNEAGLGCDPAHLNAESGSICAPPKKQTAKSRPTGPAPAATGLRADRAGLSPGAGRSGTFLPSEKSSVFDPRDESNFSPGSGSGLKTPSEFKTFPNSRPGGFTGRQQGSLSEKEAKKIKEKRLVTLAVTALGLVTIVLVLILSLFVFKEKERPVAEVVRLPQASLPKVAPVAPGFFESYSLEKSLAIITETAIEGGGSLGKALGAIGLDSRQNVVSLINYMTKDDIVPVVQPGDVIRAFWADKDKTDLARLEYLPNPQRTKSDLTPLIIMRRPDGGYWHYRPSSPLLTLSEAREATIESSLWTAGSKIGLDASIITSITEILASDIDFMTNIQQGDTFQVLYSRDYREGQPKGEPIIDMIKLTNRGRSYEYYRYVTEGDKVSYFDPEGRSSHKAFFMTPLQYKRISSHFTMTRRHPIYKVVRPHQGVDYAAPSGTPVSAVAAGTVIFCGWNGGYGKLVTIKHDATYTTMYAHLSKFAPNLQKGSTVRQGDLIGFVGSTGAATGPHLDFRMKKHGVFVDPLPALAEQKGIELDPKNKQAFIENILTPLRDEMTKKLLASREY